MSRRRYGWLAGACLILVVLLPSAGVPKGPAARADEGGLRLLGKLAEPRDAYGAGAGSHGVFLVDSQNRRAYYSYSRKFDSPDPFATYIREYDLRSTIPEFVREGRLASDDEFSPSGATLNSNIATIDRKRNRMLILSFSGTPINCSGDPTCGGRGAIGRIFVVDLKTLKTIDIWALNDRLPGLVPQGITYSPEDDRIYAVSEVANPLAVSPSNLFRGEHPRGYPTAVIALEAESGSLAWIRLVPECAVPMSTQLIGSAIFRSRVRPALYFACVRTETSLETAGLTRMWISPDARTQDALNFPVEVFPISGSYATGGGLSGSASFDPVTERFFMTSQSEVTPGTWVFDGSLSAWVGFVAAPLPNDRYTTVDELTGRLYVGGDPGDLARPGYLLLSDGRQTPVPQGRVFGFKNGAVTSPVYVDPTTRRLFLQATTKDSVAEWLVYKDLASVPEPAEEVDYDSLTNDIDEGSDTITTFAGTVNGFGSRFLLTGGTGGVRAIGSGNLDFGDVVREAIDGIVSGIFDFQPARSDRGMFAARVPSLDMRNVGAAAGARALALDPISDGEYETAVRAAANRVRTEEERRDEEREREGGRRDDEDEIGDDIERQLAWPYGQTFCIDAGDDAATDDSSSQGGTAKVSCDLKSQSVRASSTFDAFSMEGVSIGHSSFTSEVLRDPKLGISTKTTAITRGVEMSAPGGSVAIARVVATATTAARGRAKTATAEWQRRLEGVVVKDASGNVVFQCSQGESCDIAPAVDAMNRVLATRMRVSLSEPFVTASKGGALAVVEESAAAFLNGLTANNDDSRAAPALTITVYNDWTEKSRLVVELAAIQAASIYGIAPLPGSDGGGGVGGQLPVPPLTGPPPVPPILDGVLPPPPLGVGPIGQLVESPLFLIRSPKQALLFGLTLLLFVAAVVAIWRRRMLVRELSS